MTKKSCSPHYIHYRSWAFCTVELSVVCFKSANMKACHVQCCCCACDLGWSHQIKYPHLLYPGQGCLFSLMSGVSFIVSPLTIQCADGA